MYANPGRPVARGAGPLEFPHPSRKPCLGKGGWATHLPHPMAMSPENAPQRPPRMCSLSSDFPSPHPARGISGTREKAPPGQSTASRHQAFIPEWSPRARQECPLGLPRQVRHQERPAPAYTASPQHPDTTGTQRGDPVTLPPPPQPHSNRDLNIFPESRRAPACSLGTIHPPRTRAFAVIPTEKD